MKRYWPIIIGCAVLLSGCSSTPAMNLDKEVWFGKASRVGNPDTFVRLTFIQTGEEVESSFELGLTADKLEPNSQILKGTLKDRTLSVTTATASESVNGVFSSDEKTFTGTLSFVVESMQADFALSLNYETTTQ